MCKLLSHTCIVNDASSSNQINPHRIASASNQADNESINVGAALFLPTFPTPKLSIFSSSTILNTKLCQIQSPSLAFLYDFFFNNVACEIRGLQVDCGVGSWERKQWLSSKSIRTNNGDDDDEIHEERGECLSVNN